MGNDALDFNDLSPIEVPVSIDGRSYILREATGDAACRYRNALLACTQLGPEGKPSSVKGMADAEPLLVSLCLFDDAGKPVSGPTIRKWPARVLKALFDKATEISQLGEEEDDNDDKEAAKKSLSGTEDGSD